MNLSEAMEIILKSAIAGLIISALGGPRFLFPLFTDARAVFLSFVYYLTGFTVPPAVACMSGCSMIAMITHGNIFALATIAASCVLLRIIAGSEQKGQLHGGDKDA